MISQIIIILLIIGGFANYYDNQAKKEGRSFLGDMGWWFDKIAAAVAIIIAIVVFIIEEERTRRKEDKDRRDRIRRSCDALLREIRENRNHLLRGEKRFFYSYIKNKVTVDYSNIIFDMYAFQSVIHSGLLTYFRGDDQAILTKLYSSFDRYNENLRYITHLSTEFSSFGRPESVFRYLAEIEMYELFLTGIEKDIRQLSPVVEVSLETIRQNNLTNGPDSKR